MLETATVTNFFTKVQDLISVENLVGKHWLQVPDLIMDLVDSVVGVLVRILCGVIDIARITISETKQY